MYTLKDMHSSMKSTMLDKCKLHKTINIHGKESTKCERILSKDLERTAVGGLQTVLQ